MSLNFAIDYSKETQTHEDNEGLVDFSSSEYVSFGVPISTLLPNLACVSAPPSEGQDTCKKYIS